MYWRQALLALGTNTFGTGDECVLCPTTPPAGQGGETGNQIPKSPHAPWEWGKPWGFASDRTWIILVTLTRVDLYTENAKRETWLLLCSSIFTALCYIKLINEYKTKAKQTQFRSPFSIIFFPLLALVYWSHSPLKHSYMYGALI